VSAGKVVLADHSAPARTGLRLALQHGGFDVTGEASNAGQLLAMPAVESADVIVLTADLPGDGLRAAQEISHRHARVRLIVLTPEQSDDEMVAAVLAGASGYLPRDVAAERVPAIVEAVLRGEAALPRRLSGRLLEELRLRTQRRQALPVDVQVELSRREWDVLEQLGDARGTAEIAARLGISDVTVRRHISSLVAKLRVRDRGELVKLLRPDG
jgi:DNA-binding NarL/FixJ family response regulator